MPIATGMGDRLVPGPIDVNLELLARASRSATTTGAAVALEAHKLTGVEVYAYGSYSGYVSGSAEWTLTLQASTDGSSFTTVQTIPLPSGDTPRLVTSGDELRSALRNQSAKVTHLRGVLTKVGTPGDHTGGAFLTLGVPGQV